MKNEELQGEWQGLIKEKEHHKVRMDEYIKGLEALKMGFEDARSRNAALKGLEEIADMNISLSEAELEQEDEMIRELQAKLAACEKRAKPKKRKR